MSDEIDITENVDYSDFEIIPFNQSIDSVKKKYKSLIRFNFLLPFSYRKRSNFTKIRKLFVPCYLYDASIMGKVNFIGADKIMKNQKYEILHDINISFNNVLVSSNNTIDDNLISSINDYKFDSIKEYDDNFIANSTILPVNKEEIDVRDMVENKINNMVLNTVKGNVNHDLKKLDYNDTEIEFSSYKKVLIPVYSLTIKYHDKDYLFFMNGSTGNSFLETTKSITSMIILYVVLFIIFLIITVGWSIFF